MEIKKEKTFGYVDTHAHLNSPKYNGEVEKIIKQCLEENMSLLIVPGYDLTTSKKAIALAEKYDFVYASIGFHPTDVDKITDKDYEWLLKNGAHDKVVAIGECGYDFYWDKTSKQMQEVAFKKQIDIAIKLNKPLIVHCREALEITLQTLIEKKAYLVGGVMHSYSGSLEMTESFIKQNFKLGIGGPVTFLNAKEPKRVVEGVDLEHILSETDCPYLTPHPYRGKTNYPYYVSKVVEEIAKIKKQSVESMMEQLADNTLKLFKIGGIR